MDYSYSGNKNYAWCLATHFKLLFLSFLFIPTSWQDNQLEFLEDDLFIDLLNLSHLFLHGNRLWSLRQNTFRGLGVLDRLLLHQNRIQWVDRQAFHDLRRLTTLYLFNNSLTELSGATLTLLPALEYLRLNDNPWECDCKALSLWDWLRRFRGSTSSLMCVSPPELAGRDLKTLKKEELPSCISGESHAHGAPGREIEHGESLNHLNRHRNHHNHHQRPYLPHGDQYSLPSPSPLPWPPKGGRRNCTRRGRKAKGGLNEVQVLQEGGEKDYTPDGDKYDLSATTRRKNKCIPRTSVGPPIGVQRANNKAGSHHAGLVSCLSSALLLSLYFVILRWDRKRTLLCWWCNHMIHYPEPPCPGSLNEACAHKCVCKWLCTKDITENPCGINAGVILSHNQYMLVRENYFAHLLWWCHQGKQQENFCVSGINCFTGFMYSHIK